MPKVLTADTWAQMLRKQHIDGHHKVPVFGCPSCIARARDTPKTKWRELVEQSRAISRKAEELFAAVADLNPTKKHRAVQKLADELDAEFEKLSELIGDE